MASMWTNLIVTAAITTRAERIELVEEDDTWW
jgi:hypothetical protein